MYLRINLIQNIVREDSEEKDDKVNDKNEDIDSDEMREKIKDSKGPQSLDQLGNLTVFN